MKEILNYLFQHKTLSKEQAKTTLKNIASQQYSQIEIASFLTIFGMRAITIDEISGFVEALQELCLRVDLGDFDTTDMCGTGGDGKDTFNISTLSSLVVAGAGYKVAKHGNYGVSSGCGSSNVLEYFGFQFTADQDKLKHDLDKHNICFMHAPLFHPAMKEVGPVRKGMGVKTFFNMVGPLVNPSFPKRQVGGVYNLEVARIYKYLLQQSGKQFIIIHSLDGYDEISLTGNVKLLSNIFDKIVAPIDFGFNQLQPESISGGSTIPDSAKIFKDILEGNGTEAQENVIFANAALGIQVFKPKQSLVDCVAEAKESLKSGKAANVFRKLIE